MCDAPHDPRWMNDVGVVKVGVVPYLLALDEELYEPVPTSV